ncbi:ATP-binding protein [Streptomyces sp. NPDC059037]|uniref:ATP-binding protein n=1 Tax=Streptomyces sp. NPDC059037 TaxID=3346710 RepID=UPI0036750544
MQQLLEREFSAHPASVGRARTFVADALSEWCLGERANEVRLCVSELAMNAIAHGTPVGNDFLVRVALADARLRLEVSDEGNGVPELRHSDEDELGGRGLFLVAAFADDWGVATEKTGKTVWAEFKIPHTTRPEVITW